MENIMNMRHEIVDAEKLRVYSPHVIENIEELYEIDSQSLTVNTIFYEKNKYCPIAEGKNIFFAIRQQVHPDHVDVLNRVFQPDSLRQIIREKQTRQVECKIKVISGEYSWVEARIFPVTVAGGSKLLFCLSDISDRKRVADLTNEKNEMIDAFYSLYYSIVEIDLRTEKACVLKSDREGLDRAVLSVEQLYQLTIHDFAVDVEKNKIKRFFDINYLKSIASGQESASFDFQRNDGARQFKWKRIEALRVPSNTDKLYLVFSNVDEEHIVDSILKHFVFDNNDYLYYVDAKNNSFVSFYKNDENVILPPQSGNDYTGVMIDYTKKYVAPEDQDRVIGLMKPDYMAKRLREEGSYKLESGMIDKHGNYRRKEAVFQSYDKENQILFITRRDTTEEYFHQKNQKETLATAHRMANTDPLTGLCNRKGASQEIQRRLSVLGQARDAFMILDLDNFKQVNDSLGHLQGDALLQKVGKILEENFRRTDVIARLGGDEFIVYMKDITDRKAIENTLEKLLGKLKLTCQGEQDAIAVSASVGIALVPADGSRFEDLYERSDRALYQAKGKGKNRFCFFQAD